MVVSRYRQVDGGINLSPRRGTMATSTSPWWKLISKIGKYRHFEN